MNRKVLVVILLMSILTMIYIGVVVYASANSTTSKPVYAVFRASEYESETPPANWYTPEQLGIVGISESEEGWLAVEVEVEPFPLEQVKPVFEYKDKFYRISDLILWVEPGLPEHVKQGWRIPIGVGIGAGWAFVGWLGLKQRRNPTKNLALVGLVCLLIASACVNILGVSASSASNEDVCVGTPGLPEDICNSEPIIPSNYAVEDSSPWDEVGEGEGCYPIYALVFGDEESRDSWNWVPSSSPAGGWADWDHYAQWQLERGDECLVSNYNIDIRILGFENWDSDDSLTTMAELWFELEADTQSYLGQWYDGTNWDDYVDVVVGITDQETTDPVAGYAPSPISIDQERIFVLLKWQTYWADDNLVQHEFSHLFFAPHEEEPEPCCTMAIHHHFHYIIFEGGIGWVILADVYCFYTCYDWCTSCSDIINAYKVLYQNYDYGLIVRHSEPANPPGGTLSPEPGIHMYDGPTSVWASAVPYSGYIFASWRVNGGNPVTDNPIVIHVNKKKTVTAFFTATGDTGPWGPWCPTLFVWNGTDYSEEGMLNIHAESDITLQHQIQQSLVQDDFYKLQLRELDNFTSHIDQVKLYAVDNQGEWHSCPLIRAKHNEFGRVEWKLLFDDNNRVDLAPTQVIDLKFSPSISHTETTQFIFEINGYNAKVP